MRAIVIALAACACACGRVGFDPLGGDDVNPSDASGDGSGDGALTTSGTWTPFVPAPPTTADLYSVWAFAPTDLWIGGVNGIAYRFDGTTWASHPVGFDVYMLWGLAANDLWEVGRQCEVQRWNGTAWTPVTVPGCTSSSYFGIGGISANDVWLVGVAGALEHFVGGSFTAMTQANNIDLWAVAPISASEAYFVGTRGTILHWVGNQILDESIGQNLIMTSVWRAPNDDVWVVGGAGRIFRKPAGGAWTAVTSPTSTFLYWVSGTSATDIWAVGEFGVTLHYDGVAWSMSTQVVTTALRTIAAVPGGGLRMVGHGGAVLRNP